METTEDEMDLVVDDADDDDDVEDLDYGVVEEADDDIMSRYGAITEGDIDEYAKETLTTGGGCWSDTEEESDDLSEDSITEDDDDAKLLGYCFPTTATTKSSSRLMSTQLPALSKKANDSAIDIIFHHGSRKKGRNKNCTCLSSQCPEGDQRQMIGLINGVRQYVSANIGEDDEDRMYDFIKSQLQGK